MTARGQPMKPGQIKAIIYDCDGVLIDSRDSNEAYYNHILEHFGQPPLTVEHLRMIQFLTAGEVMALIFDGTSLLVDALTFEKTLDNDRFYPPHSCRAKYKRSSDAFATKISYSHCHESRERVCVHSLPIMGLPRCFVYGSVQLRCIPDKTPPPSA